MTIPCMQSRPLLFAPNSNSPAMSLFCSISGTQPLHPVVSSKSGHVYEKELILKALANNDGKDPITAEELAEQDLIEVKTGQ